MKGSVRGTILVIFGVIALAVLLVSNFLAEKNIRDRKNIGETQFELIDAYSKAENDRRAVDEIARISLANAVHKAAAAGGVNNPECAFVDGYVVWNQKGDCSPGKVEDVLKQEFDNLFRANSDADLNSEVRIGENLEVISRAGKGIVYGSSIEIIRQEGDG